MCEVQDLLQELCECARHPAQTVKSWMQWEGRGAVGCFPLYGPEEIIDAAGLLPVGLWGGATKPQLCEKYVQPFCCSIMKANLEQGMQGQYDELTAVTIPCFCDTLKCVCENWKVAVPQIPLIPMVYPQNRTSSGAVAYLEAEFQTVVERLEELTGKTITEEDLERGYQRLQASRAAQRQFVQLAGEHSDVVSASIRHLVIKAGWFMDRGEYAEKLNQINRLLAQREPVEPKGLRLVVTGISMGPEALLDVMDNCGVTVVADDLAQESRQFGRPGEPQGTVLSRMARNFLGMSGDPLVWDQEKHRGEKLIRLAQESKADGVLVIMMKFCDPEEFDYPIYKKELEAAGIPILYTETELSMTSMAHLQTRLEGFGEMLNR